MHVITKRPEIMVFGAILLFVITLSVAVTLPQTSKTTLPVMGKSPELSGISRWINTEPFSLAQLRGKVILIDFWTYSCINCIRTLPYLKSWHEKYADKGLVIVGVHTPEFEFEKDYDNVVNAVKRYDIQYRVVQDNDYATWKAYKNQFWPRKYLIDKDGFIRYDHIGEGGYEETELAIQTLLGETGAGANENVTRISQGIDYGSILTPELYFGYGFARAPLGNNEGFHPGETVEYVQTTPALKNIIYLSGRWQNNRDNVKSAGQSGISLVYTSKSVNIVASGNGTALILLDGKPVEADSGTDVTNGLVSVRESRLYNIIHSLGYGSHRVDIVVTEGTIEAYAFTFG